MNVHAARSAIPVLGVLVLTVLSSCQQAVDAQVDGRGVMAQPNVTFQEFGDYIVHFNALPTDQIPPDVAGTYGITRSKNRAMLNISIIKHSAGGGLGTPTAGTVKATATNLTGQFKSTTVREIREGEAIYYIAVVPVANREVLTFNIEATPENESEPLAIRFQKQFFTD